MLGRHGWRGRPRHRVPVRAAQPGPAVPSFGAGDRRGSPASTSVQDRPEERPLTEQDETAAPLALAEGFPPATAEQWWDLVGAVLQRSRGLDEAPDPATALDLLSTTTYDGVRIRPLYTPDDHVADSGFPGVAPYVRGSRPTGLCRQGWDVRQHFGDPDSAVTRQAVLTDLENGVTSLWLQVGASGIGASDLPEVLADVLLDLAPVVLDAGVDTPDAAARLMAVWRDRLTDPAAATGNLGLDPLGVQA